VLCLYGSHQINVLVENIPGGLSELCNILENLNVNINALSTTSEKETVPVSLIVSDTEKVSKELQEKKYQIEVLDAIAAETPHHPGGLNSILKPLAEENINIKSIYPTVSRKTSDAIIIMQTSDNIKAEEILKKNWIKLLTVDDL
jgi:hypothetical protein